MNQRKPLTKKEKDYIYEQKEQGGTLKEIADALNCSYETARKWWRHRRDGTEPRPRGRPVRGVLSSYPSGVREKAVALKRQNPSQGPDKIRLDLQDALELKEAELPSGSRLAVLFREECPEAVTEYKQQQYPEKAPPSATTAHSVWQMDGKEKVPYGLEEVATVLNLRDAYTSLMIASRPFPTTTKKGWRKLTLSEVQNTLRHAFEQWGLPQAIQTDHEVVYVGAPERYFPSLFTLWLVGLGIDHLLSRSRRPTDQGTIERAHRTQGNWVWDDIHFATIAPLQAALNQANHCYNERYPARTKQCDRQPPLVAHPHARHSGRSFHPAAEWVLFDMERVDRFLADHVWIRQANDNATVSVAGCPYYLGAAYKGQSVSVTFQPDSRSFRFETNEGSFITEKPALELDKADIIGLTPVDKNWPCFQEPFQLPLVLEGV